MRIFRALLLAVGIILALGGLVWIGQGSGYFPYPASSFMIDQTIWIYRGMMMFAGGVIVIIVSRAIKA